MAKNVKLLDCTLRDGGRIINCAFPDVYIHGIAKGLTRANIDIVEIGFLRGKGEYKGDSTFFTELDQIKPFIPADRGNSMFVAFSDYGEEYGMWDFSRIKPYDGTGIDGFRVGYRKKDLKNALDTFRIVKDNGYKLFIQGVESLSYTDLEMLQAIEIVNDIKPYSFGIVDTYGAMYKDDVLRLFSLLDNNLDDDIAIDFHSHNNMQLSFSFAQEVVEASRGVRPVIIDTTLEGVGKGTGNLNTELMVDYLNRKKFYNYDADIIFDTIDDYIEWIKKDHTWEYQIPYLMAGIYSSHANNIIYLQDKHRLSTRDIKNILSMIDPQKRKRYDYDNIERLYIEYSGMKTDDREAVSSLRKALSGKKCLVLVPGPSLVSEKEKIDRFIAAEHPAVISLNFVDDRSDYVFFGNLKKYERFYPLCAGKEVIVSSNIPEDKPAGKRIDYNGIIDRKLKYFDNSAVMLLNLLLKLGDPDIAIAGLDGFTPGTNNYYSEDYNVGRYEDDYNQVNHDLEAFLKDYSKRLSEKGKVSFLTSGRFSDLF